MRDGGYSWGIRYRHAYPPAVSAICPASESRIGPSPRSSFVLHSLFAEAPTRPVGAFGIQSGALSSYTVLHEELYRRVRRLHHHKRHLSDGRASRARDHADLRRCCADVPGKEDQVSTHPGSQKSQERLRMEQPTMSAPGESRQTAVEQVSRF
jgi:hypothetical protein